MVCLPAGTICTLASTRPSICKSSAVLESIRSTAICLVSSPYSISFPAKLCIWGRPHRKLPVSVTKPAYIACAISELRVTPSSSSTGAKTVVVDSHETSTKLILPRSEEHTSELQSRGHLVCRLLLEKKN